MEGKNKNKKLNLKDFKSVNLDYFEFVTENANEIIKLVNDGHPVFWKAETISSDDPVYRHFVDLIFNADYGRKKIIIIEGDEELGVEDGVLIMPIQYYKTKLRTEGKTKPTIPEDSIEIIHHGRHYSPNEDY